MDGATCPNCGSKNVLGDRFCGQCGSALPYTPTRSSTAIVVSPAKLQPRQDAPLQPPQNGSTGSAALDTSATAKSKSSAPVIIVVIVLLLVACVVWSVVKGGDASRPDYPQPGSWADVMCDTNETGPGIVALGGKHYDEDCLKAYSWTDKAN